MLTPILTLATPASEIESIHQVEFLNAFTPGFRFVPGNKVPVITNENNNKVTSLIWGLPSGIKGKVETPWLRSEGIIKKTGLRILVRTHRCIVFTNCFYSRNDESVYLFYHPKEKVIMLAGIWNTVRSADNTIQSYFAVLTRESPMRLKKYFGRVPVILSKSSIRKYINTKLPLMDTTGILNNINYPELNGYTIDASIFQKQEWTRKDLLPMGDRLFSERKFPEKAILHNRYYFS